MGRRILVSAGHGAGDPGAPSPGGAEYPFTEADLTLELRDLVAPLLAELGHVVTRDGKEGESLSKSESKRRVATVDLALDIHFNGSDKPGATGVECLGLDRHRGLCQRLAKTVATLLGLKLRGQAGYLPQTQSQHGAKGLGFCLAGGVLLEVCFMNRADLDAYLPKKAEVAAAIAAVLHAHCADSQALRSVDLRRGRKRVGPKSPGELALASATPHRRPTV